MNSRRSSGLSLIEVLASMGVLIIGMTAIATMLFTTTRLGRTATERNAVAAIITEAVADIERRHLIHPTMDTAPTGTLPSIPATDIGLLIETVNSANKTPSIHSTVTPYGTVSVGPARLGLNESLKAPFLDTPDPTKVHFGIWPLPSENPKYLGGFVRGTPPDPVTASGTAIRVIYRLERHPDWQPHTQSTDPSIAANYGTMDYSLPENLNSPYCGMYVLTLVVYKQSIKTLNPKLEWGMDQLSEPYVVHIRDHKVRN